MEPITTTLVAALVAGAAAGASGVVSEAVREAYEALKGLVVQRLGGQGEVVQAVAQVEAKPDSVARQGVLQEELEGVVMTLSAGEESELRALAEKLRRLLVEQGRKATTEVKIRQRGSGAVAYGPGAKAAGARGVVADTIYGNVATGDHARQIQAGTYIERQEGTGSGGERAGTQELAEKVVTILFLAANPVDEARLALEEEMRQIDLVLRQGEYGRRFRLEKHLGVRADELQALLMRYQPEIVHFSGHGEEGEILLQDGAGRRYGVPGLLLGQIFKTHGQKTRCVVLNACYSQEQAAAIGEEVACVVGMREKIPDGAAIAFAMGFYEALAYGKSVAAAVEGGRLQIDVQGALNSGIVEVTGQAEEIVFVP